MSRVWRVAVTCEKCHGYVVDFEDQPRDPRTGEVAVTTDGRVPEDAPSNWVLFVPSAWSGRHGPGIGAIATFYDTPSDPSVLRTRSHRDPQDGDLVIRCAGRLNRDNRCGNWDRFTDAECQHIIGRLAEAGQRTVTIEVMREARERFGGPATRRDGRRQRGR